MSGKLECGISWADLALAVDDAMRQATLGAFPGAGGAARVLPGSDVHEARAATLEALLGKGEGVLEGRKFSELAVLLMHGCQARLGLPLADPAPEVVLIWEAGVRHAAGFLEADEDDVPDLLAGAEKWREWAAISPRLPRLAV